MPLKFHTEDRNNKKVVFDTTVKLLKEKQQQKPDGQRITNEKIEGYAEYQSRKQNGMAIQPLKSYGLDPQTFTQLEAEFDSMSETFAMEFLTTKMNMMESPTQSLDNKEIADLGTRILMVMIKEKQREKPVRDRVLDELVDKFEEWSLSIDCEDDDDDKEEEWFDVDDHDKFPDSMLAAMTADYHEISDSDAYKTRILEAKERMMQEKQKPADSVDVFSDVSTSESESSVCGESSENLKNSYTKAAYPKRVLRKMETLRKTGLTEDQIELRGAYLCVEYKNLKKEKKKFLAANPGGKFNPKKVVTPVFEINLPGPLLQQIKNTETYRRLTGN